MPHVAFVPFTGLRVREKEMLKLGMKLPGLRERAEAIGGLPSLGLMTLAGMTPDHWTCSYHPSADTSSLVDDVLKTRPDLIAVSALTASVLEAYQFCEQLRQCNLPTVIGGLHVTSLPEEAEQYSTSVCVGDGESSWLEILQDAERRALKKRYIPKRPFDLAQSPTPRFQLLGRKNGQPVRWTLQTQRGCPWACEFCGASRLLGPARFKPVEKIRGELAAIKELDSTPWVELADDNTFAGRQDSIKLLEVLADFQIQYFTESDWRIGEDPELLKALADSGCAQVLVGIESLNFKYRGMGRKNAEQHRMQEAVEAIQDHGIVVNGCFIVGAEGETPESLTSMVEFVNDSQLAEVQITLQTPFPGTELFRKLKRNQRIIEDRDWSYYTLFDVVFRPDKMSVESLEAGFKDVMQGVFSPSASAKRNSMRRKIWRRRFSNDRKN